MDRDELAKLFWKRVTLRLYELNITARKVESEVAEITGKKYRLTESKCRNCLPETYTICALAQILKTTTDYLLGFVDNGGSVDSKELRVLELYRTDKHVKTIVDNLLDLTQ